MAAADDVYRYRVEDRIGIFRFVDRIEVFQAEQIRQAVYSRLEEDHLRALVFSFREVPYIDSSGVGVFVNLQYQIGTSVPIRMCEVSQPVRDVLTFTNLVSRFAIDDTEHDSLAQLQEA